jgi:hypothetical protein
MKRIVVLVMSLMLLAGGVASCGSANGSGGTSSSSRPGY